MTVFSLTFLIYILFCKMQIMMTIKKHRTMLFTHGAVLGGGESANYSSSLESIMNSTSRTCFLFKFFMSNASSSVSSVIFFPDRDVL